MRTSHEVDYEIIGDDMQIVEIELDPDETVIAEAGAMNYMEQGIQFETKMGDGTKPDSGVFGKLLDAGKRAASSVCTAMPSGRKGAMRACVRPASNAAISSVRAPDCSNSVSGRAGTPARGWPRCDTSWT